VARNRLLQKSWSSPFGHRPFAESRITSSLFAVGTAAFWDNRPAAAAELCNWIRRLILRRPVRRQHAANPVRQRPAAAINRQSFTAILSLVARFKAVRESQGLTLAEVAERMGIDPPALSRLETGKMLNPTLATLHKWAEALGQKLEVGLSPA
jgi:DNA-binding XRE family transcriptional regulator